jgi:hypothetical protein
MTSRAAVLRRAIPPISASTCGAKASSVEADAVEESVEAVEVGEAGAGSESSTMTGSRGGTV